MLETLESRLALDGTPSGGTGGGDPTLLQLVVSTSLDEVDGDHSAGDLSLREAVILANYHVGDVEIELPAGLYRLTIPRASLDANAQNDAATGDLFIRNEFGTTRITGASAGTTIIDANGLDRAFTIARGEITLANLSIRGGNATEIGTGTLGSPFLQGNGGAIFVDDSLHLIDSIIETSHAPGLGGGIYVVEGAGLTIDGSKIRANWARQGGGLWLQEDANIAIHNSQFLQNTATDAGGGMYLREPIVEMTGTMIRGNYAAVSGGGIYVDRSDLNIDASTISENFAGIQGGGIYLASESPVEIASSTISSNTTGPDGSGGGIYIHYGDSVTISDTEITHNVAGATSGRGGGIDAAPANPSDVTSVLQITGGTIANNTAVDGGGIALGQNVDAAIVGVSFVQNTANRRGGGLYSDAMTLDIADSTFIENLSNFSGGALFVEEGRSLSMAGSSFVANRATHGGGVFLREDVTAVIRDTNFLRNATTGDGGAIYVDEDVNVRLEATTIRENSADDGAGIFLAEDSTLTARSVLFEANVALYDGGAIATHDGADMTIESSRFLDNRAETSGGAIAIDGNDSRFQDVEFRGNSAGQSGGAVYLDDDGISAIFVHSVIAQNSVGQNGQGGGIYSYWATLTLDDVTVSENVTGPGGSGGGLYLTGPLSSSNQVTLTNSSIVGNSASYGGGLFAENQFSVAISDSFINNNIAAFEGGGLVNDSGTVLLDHTEVRGNQIVASVNNPFVEVSGGGILNIANSRPAQLSLVASQVTFNTIVAESMNDAAAGGGGIANISNVLSASDLGPPQAIITIDGGSIAGNSVTARLRAGTTPSSPTTIRAIGGGVFSSANVGNTAITIRGSKIEDNLAEAGQGRNESHPTVLGGGIYYQALNESTLSILDTRINGNLAQNDGSAGARGGGLYYDLDDFADEMNSTLEIERTTISDNTVYGSAPTLGGGAYLNGKSISILQSTIAGNSAVTEDSHGSTGGGIYALGTAAGLVGGEMLIEGTSISGNDATSGGGIAIGALLETRITNSTVTNNSALLVGGGLKTEALATPVSLEPTVRLANVDIVGNTAQTGAGVYNDRNQFLQIQISSITDNTASIQGGGIVNAGASIRVFNTEIRGNRVVGIGGEDQPMYGGGVLNLAFGSPAIFELINSQVVDNSLESFVPQYSQEDDDYELLGAGIANVSGNREATLRVSNSEIRGNSISFASSAAFLDGDVSAKGAGIASTTISTTKANVTVEQSTISDNRISIPSAAGIDGVIASGGGIYADGISGLSVYFSTIANNEVAARNDSSGDDTVAIGGGIAFMSRSPAVRMDVNHATISGNVVSAINPAHGEGRIGAIGAGVSLYDMTIGPASSPAEIVFSTIAFNRAYAEIDAHLPDSDEEPQPLHPAAAGAYGRGAALAIYQSIVGSNESTVVTNSTNTAETIHTPAASYTDLGFNLLVGQESNAWLGKLAYNGGRTHTHALLSGSPAIDSGNPAFNPHTYDPPLSMDQREQPRVLDGNGDGTARIDIGAYEFSRTFLLGDLNGDGQVGVRDLIVVQQHLGHSDPTYAQGDLNADGLVDAADIAIVAAHLGNRLPTSASASAGAVVVRAVTSATASAYQAAVASEVERPAAREVRRRAIVASPVDHVFAATAIDSAESLDAGKLRVRRRSTV